MSGRAEKNLRQNAGAQGGKKTTAKKKKIAIHDDEITEEVLQAAEAEGPVALANALRKVKPPVVEMGPPAAGGVQPQTMAQMRAMCDRLRTSNDNWTAKNEEANNRYQSNQMKLAIALADVPLPNHPNGANIDNIIGYMRELNQLSADGQSASSDLRRARDIIKTLDLEKRT